MYDKAVTLLLEAPKPEKRAAELHMAIDTSSLSFNPEGVIGSLGFLVFDPRDAGGATETYMKTVDWDQKGRAYSMPRVQQWLMSSSMARRCLVNFSKEVPLLAAMSAVVETFKRSNCIALWGNRIALDQVEDAASYCKLTVPWGHGQIRDIAAACSTSGELGNVISMDRDPTEPEDVPLGNAAFIARAVRYIYQAKGTPRAVEETL